MVDTPTGYDETTNTGAKRERFSSSLFGKDAPRESQGVVYIKECWIVYGIHINMRETEEVYFAVQVHVYCISGHGNHRRRATKSAEHFMQMPWIRDIMIFFL